MYLGLPIVKTVVKFGIDFVVVVVLSVGSQPDEAEAHERRDQSVVSGIASQVELDAVPVAVQSAIAERAFHLFQHGLPQVDLRLHFNALTLLCHRKETNKFFVFFGEGEKREMSSVRGRPAMTETGKAAPPVS